MCEAYRTLADNHRLAREQAISALMAIRKIAADRKSIGNSDEWPGENLESALALLSAVDQECFEWLTQWGVATNAEV